MDKNNALVMSLHIGSGDVPVVVKDCIDIAGFATRSGSGCFADAQPAVDNAAVVDSILIQGGRIVGKANMHELAVGVTGINAAYGTPVNPTWPDRIPGGSSSGSAVAVAAGLVPMAIGTDTGGSIRMPATCCGVFGLKPTFGRISRVGCTPSVSTLDCVGPLARDLDGIEQGMRLIDPSFRPVATPDAVRVARVEAMVDETIQCTVDDFAIRSGAKMRSVTLSSFDAAYRAGLTIMAHECWAAFGAFASDPRMGSDVRARLLNAGKTTNDERVAAEEVRTRFAAEVDAVLDDMDVLLLPTLPSVPPTIEGLAADQAVVLNMTALVRPFNLSGHPALTLPVRTAEGLPAGIQLVAKRGAEAQLIAAARRLSGGAA